MFWSQHLGCWGQNTSRIQNKEVYATLDLQASPPHATPPQPHDDQSTSAEPEPCFDGGEATGTVSPLVSGTADTGTATDDETDGEDGEESGMRIASLSPLTPAKMMLPPKKALSIQAKQVSRLIKDMEYYKQEAAAAAQAEPDADDQPAVAAHKKRAAAAKAQVPACQAELSKESLGLEQLLEVTSKQSKSKEYKAAATASKRAIDYLAACPPLPTPTSDDDDDDDDDDEDVDEENNDHHDDNESSESGGNQGQQPPQPPSQDSRENGPTRASKPGKRAYASPALDPDTETPRHVEVATALVTRADSDGKQGAAATVAEDGKTVLMRRPKGTGSKSYTSDHLSCTEEFAEDLAGVAEGRLQTALERGESLVVWGFGPQSCDEHRRSMMRPHDRGMGLMLGMGGMAMAVLEECAKMDARQLVTISIVHVSAKTELCIDGITRSTSIKVREDPRYGFVLDGASKIAVKNLDEVRFLLHVHCNRVAQLHDAVVPWSQIVSLRRHL